MSKIHVPKRKIYEVKTMATKAQIAKKKYGCTLSNLTSGEKAAVTRLFNAQDQDLGFGTYTKNPVNTAKVDFGRPGVNGTKGTLVAVGTSIGDALKQADIKLTPKKEGVMEKESGNVVMFNDPVKDGAIYMICPGIDSSE